MSSPTPTKGREVVLDKDGRCWIPHLFRTPKVSGPERDLEQKCKPYEPHAPHDTQRELGRRLDNLIGFP